MSDHLLREGRRIAGLLRNTAHTGEDAEHAEQLREASIVAAWLATKAAHALEADPEALGIRCPLSTLAVLRSALTALTAPDYIEYLVNGDAYPEDVVRSAHEWADAAEEVLRRRLETGER